MATLRAITGRTMLYKAQRRRDGKSVCLDPELMAETTQIVDTQADYDLARSLGWWESPGEALAALEAQEDQISTNAAIRAWDDRRLTPAAQAEARAVDSTTIRHLPEIPVAPKKGRSKTPTVQ